MHDERDFALRAATREDRELLYAIYASSRRDEVAHFGWSREQEDAFLRLQFEAQDRGLPGERHVVLAGGQPVGRLYVERIGTEVRLVDITLLPGGTGTGLDASSVSRRAVVATGVGVAVTAAVATPETALAAPRRTHQQLMRSSFARSVGQAFAAGTSTIRLRAIADPPFARLQPRTG